MSLAAATPPRTESPPLEEDSLYEIVDGQRVEKPMAADALVIASVLGGYLIPFARTHRLGRVVIEGLFSINPKGAPERRPDVAFVSYARWPRERPVPSTSAWEVAPDLAVEVVSPSNRAVEVVGKVREYFQGGVLRVWLVYPTEKLVYVYESPMRNNVLGLDDAIDGGDLLPGFRLAVADLFDDAAGAEE